MIRCWAFQPLVSAFDIVDLPLGKKHTDPRYEDHVQETRRCMVRNFYRAVNIVFGSDFDEFEARLVDIIIKLNMSTGFDPIIAEEFLNVIAATFVPHNANIKFVFYGKNETGRSDFCKLIQILTSPDVASVLDLKEITERANLNVKCNVIIINEISEVRAAQIKSITGNDESAKIFYTQDYEMHESSRVTNNVIPDRKPASGRRSYERPTDSRHLLGRTASGRIRA